MTEPRKPMWKPESLEDILSGRIGAYPAVYRGVRMRSQLEADFAKHLDDLGVTTWEYEPQRYYAGERSYLPDFLIGRTKFFEIKPTQAEVDEAARRMEVIFETVPDATLTVVCAEGCRFYTRTKATKWRRFVERWRHG